MAIQTITFRLSDTVLKRAQQAAAILHRPVEDVLAAALDAALPNMDDAPAILQAELAAMTWTTDQELWAIARSAMPKEQQGRLQDLAEQQAKRTLTSDEQNLLEALRNEYGRVTLRKARAFALLSLRGGRPLLTDHS